MKNLYSNQLILLTIFLSLYGPPLFGQIYLYHVFMIICVTYFAAINVNYKFTKNSFIALTVMLALVLIFILKIVATSLMGSLSLSQASIGGLEGYLEIFFGLFFGFILYKNGVSLIIFRRFVLFFQMPITTLAITVYIISPDTAMSFINNFLYGVTTTAQWRFSAFYGLPYYAAIGYLVFLFEIVLGLRTILRKSTGLYLRLSFIIIFIGGVLAASKTFLLGAFVLFIFAIVTAKKPFKLLLMWTVLLPISLIMIIQNLDYSFTEQLKLVNSYSFYTIYETIEFRYFSAENPAVGALYSDNNWNPFIGIGGEATNVPTDSQFRDLVYRFGYMGLILFVIFISSVFYHVSIEYKFLLIMLAIGGVGSNGFSPIGSTLIIWTLISLNIFENRKYNRYHLA